MIALFVFLATLGQGADHTPFYADKADLLYYLDESNSRVVVETPEAWTHRRNHILDNMQMVMGPLPEMDRSMPPAYDVIEEEVFPQYRRQTIHYTVDGWDKVPAFLFLPTRDGDEERLLPAALCLHPTSPIGKRVVAGEGERANRNYAVELAERGYVTLAPDYPGFGDYVDARKRLYNEGYVSCTMKGIVNHIRAIDLLQSLPQVDPERIGCIGHSLGGHNTLFVSVFDSRVKVAVTSCGFTTFAKYMDGDLTGWTHDGYMPRIDSVYDKDPARMPFDFTEVVAAIAPRALFICAPVNDHNFEVSGVKDAVNAARPVFELFGAQENLRAAYPDAEHDFPTETRHAAYAFMDVILKK